MSLTSARMFAVGLLVLLSGCALFPSAPAPATRPAQSDAIPFALNGRISVTHQDKRDSAGLRWTHQAQTDEILLFAPLGQTVARIYSDTRIGSQQATLDESDHHYRDHDPESLMEQVLGWHLPLNGLHHWVLAMADPETPSQIERADNGQITALRQNGWEVRYLKYTDAKPDSLPVRIELIHEDMKLLLLIDEWDWDIK